jgi:hypothetical protein
MFSRSRNPISVYFVSSFIKLYENVETKSLP